jgi:succinate-semialdehyde dehydrogenase
MNLSATHAVSVNPTTGEVVSSLPWASEREVDAAISLAAAGYRQWRQTPLADAPTRCAASGPRCAPAVKRWPR